MKTKSSKKHSHQSDKKSSGKAFEDYYLSVYEQRWSDLFRALKSEEKQVIWLNPFLQKNELLNDFLNQTQVCPSCYEVNHAKVPYRIEPEGLLSHYVLDLGSALVVEAMKIEPSHQVLDLCAGPGGKSLLILNKLYGIRKQSHPEGMLVANELSRDRRERMKKIFAQYLPNEVKSRIQMKGIDGGLIGMRQPEMFDRVLVDAPCSGERHLIKNSLLNEWSLSRSEKLAIRQYALLASGWMALKAGGILVYSTCSISPKENDQVVAKLMKRKASEVELIPYDVNCGENTEFGYQIFPDKTGYGPIFFSILKKQNLINATR